MTATILRHVAYRATYNESESDSGDSGKVRFLDSDYSHSNLSFNLQTQTYTNQAKSAVNGI